MTKAEYMSQLQKRLESFSRELQEDIMEDYRQHFAEGELQGKTDEEIIQELGTIEDMIRDLPESDLKEDIDSRLPNMTEVSNHVSQSVSETGKSNPPAGTALTEYTSTDKTKQTFTYPGTYKAIVLNGEDANIYLEDSQDDQIHVEYVNRSKTALEYEYYQYEENGIFYAGVRRKKNTEANPQAKGNGKSWKITLFGETIISYGNMKNIHSDISFSLSVKVPECIRKLHTKAASGDIHIPHLTKAELLLESASGDIKAYRITSDTLQMHVSSGDIDMDNIVCQKKLGIKTHSGDLAMKRITADVLEVAVSSGDVNITGIKCRQAQTEGVSGDVSMDDVTAQSLEIRSASGDISITSASLELLNAEVSSGDIGISGTNFTTGNISARSGDLSFSGLRFGTGSFTSTQGDISVTNSEFDAGNLVTKNGDIDIRAQVKVCECTALGGDISVNIPGEPRKLSLQSISGDLNVNTIGTPENVILRSDNGDICLKMSQTQGMEINMDAGWGDSEIRWEGERRNMKKGVCTYGNGASKVTVCCKRGDVSISGSRQ